jgi:prepilin-type N-terminal cleavage/methylation domain-containing protein
MKTPLKPISRKGFTLIELLVVIAIIAVLAAAGFSVGPAMMNRAKKVSAQASATALAGAVEQFYTEYSALPDPGSNSSDAEFNTSASGNALLRILSGENVNDQNPRQIRFLTAKQAKNGMDGMIYVSGNVSSMLDPWGQPFYIRLDYDYNESLTVDPSGTAPSVTLPGRRVAVYSLGVRDLPQASAKTLVKSW